MVFCQSVVEAACRLSDRHDDDEVEEQLEGRRRPVCLVRGPREERCGKRTMASRVPCLVTLAQASESLTSGLDVRIQPPARGQVVVDLGLPTLHEALVLSFREGGDERVALGAETRV